MHRLLVDSGANCHAMKMKWHTHLTCSCANIEFKYDYTIAILSKSISPGDFTSTCIFQAEWLGVNQLLVEAGSVENKKAIVRALNEAGDVVQPAIPKEQQQNFAESTVKAVSRGVYSVLLGHMYLDMRYWKFGTP